MLKDIIERPSQAPTAPTAPQPRAPGGTGFPVAVHRSQRPSAFAKARQQQAARQAGQKVVGEGKAVDAVPALQISSPVSEDVKHVKLSEVDEVRKSVEAENIRRVEGMSQTEREDEVEELKEIFGGGIVDLMRKRKEARETKQPLLKDRMEPSLGNTASELSAFAESGPSSKPFDMPDTRKMLDEVSEENTRRVQDMSSLEREQEFEDLQERFGGKLMDALRKRAELKGGKGKDKDIEQESNKEVSSQSTQISSHLIEPARSQSDDPTLSELKTYFPSVSSESSKLAWVQPIPSTTASSTSPRFDLSGNLLSVAQQADLPSHLGLHHHGSSPDLAGYTIQEILYLCRSIVPSQRITMMGVLTNILSKLRQGNFAEDIKEECMRNEVSKRAVELGTEIVAGLSRGIGIIQAGVELLFEALGGHTWTWLDGKANEPIRFTLDDENTGVSGIPFEDVLPRLQELLSVEDGLSPQTIQQLILILRRATLISPDTCETICPLFPAVLRGHVTSRSWPPNSPNGHYPSIDALKLLKEITTSSRACAEDLLGQGIYETTLRFVVTATWDSKDINPDIEHHGQSLALEVLEIYSVLGRYGLSSNVVTSSSEVWRLFSQWIRRLSSPTPIERGVIKAYFKLLEVWVTCSIDPHRTTPEHDLTWAQVSAMKWEDEAITMIDKISGREANEELIALTVAMLGAWTKGITINGVRGGEEEKTDLLGALKKTSLVDKTKSVLASQSDQVKEQLLAATVQLHRLLQDHGQLLSSEIIEQLKQRYLSQGTTSHSRHITYLRYDLVNLNTPSPITISWLSSAFSLFDLFQIGDEPLALDLLDKILKAELSPLIPELSDMSHSDGLQILRPLLQYAILPNVESITAPYQPCHLYLKATSTLRSSASPRNDEKPSSAGLPLEKDWIFSTLTELLRSGTSEALQQVPPDWQASETQLVHSTLLLAKLKYLEPIESLDRARLIFNLMKIHMLEHGQTGSNIQDEAEVFRDPFVSQLMSDTISKLTNPSSIQCQSQSRLSSDSQVKHEEIDHIAALEKVSLNFLGSGVPFYQFYIDFVALYESISFSDTLFTQLLLSPLTMDYPPDYRRLIWNDHSTSLKGMRIDTSQIPLITAQGIRAYFDPPEQDQEILTCYARALTNQWIIKKRNEFLYNVAIHHLSELFWNTDQVSRDSMRVGLMIMILSKGDDTLIGSILRCNLEILAEGISDEEKSRRKELVVKLTGERGRKRVEDL
ncbi:uncharacterized protein IL334_006271 [Kwoniella shivajii]|uniref:Cytoplasmic protein n=1 Tax=Kwoniella shivajii TaxID=564305 RepID=A0ABZ1D6Q6_9TREE|nr:hypothetical protein IL334_006271 [Kwoniella shivajii]